MKKLGLTLLILFIIAVFFQIFLSKSGEEFIEGDLYGEIIQRGYIKVGINTDSKPFGFYDSKGKLTGYDVDLAKYIAQYILKDRNRVEFVAVTPTNRLLKASTGEVDIVISTVTITPQRKEVVEFSSPYDSAGMAILTKTSSAIQGLQDLSEQNVGVIFGTTAEKSLQKMNPTAHLVGFRSYQDAYLALKSGKISAITSDDTILNRFAIDDREVKLLPRRYSNEPYGIAFKKGIATKKLKEELNYALKDMQRKNVMVRLRKKWDL